MDPVKAEPCLSPYIQESVNLYKAIDEQNVEEVEKIIRKSKGKIDCNKIVVGMEMSLLHLAVGLSNNSPEIVLAFLRIGGDPNNLNCSEGLSPTHLSVMNDFDEVFHVLLIHGGDPYILSGDGNSCFSIAIDNQTNCKDEKCFELLLRKYSSFRKSMTPVDMTVTKDPTSFRKMNMNYSYLMTEDESNGITSDTDTSSERINDKLTATPEDTEPLSVSILSMDTESCSSCATGSCAKSTPPLSVSSSREQLERLQANMKKVNIPVPPTTYPILSRLEGAEQDVERMLASSLTPFSSELRQAIGDLNLINYWGQLKINLLQGAACSPTGPTTKSFYNYILLDPKIIIRANFSGNYLKSGVIKNSQKFEKFLSAVFYIGKGCGSRPIQQLVEAKARLIESRHKQFSYGQTVDKILDIWKAGLGVVLVSFFHHSSEREANVNEAAMIDAVGLIELSNLNKGSYLGSVATQWSQKVKNQFCSFLLYKCFCAFAVSGPKYFKPSDI